MARLLPDHVYIDGEHVLDAAIEGLKNHDMGLIRSVSNQTIHNASIFQDNFSINIAIITYALSQLLENTLVKNKPVDMEKYLRHLVALKETVRSRQPKVFEKLVGKIYAEMKKDENRFSQFVRHVKTQARMDKSARLVDHGISVARAADVLGVSQWQMYSYLGKTKITDDGSDSVANMKKRLEFARGLLVRK